jgi:polar amino acid transport system substrate-binding protein
MARWAGRLLRPAASPPAEDRIEFLMCDDLEIVPVFFRDAAGQPVGFDLDIGRAICAALGVGCAFRGCSNRDIFAALLAGRGDAMLAGVMVTEERKALVDFTRPYHHDGLWVVLRRELQRTADRAGMAGLRIGVYADTEPERLARERFGDVATIVALAGSGDIVQALIDGRVDAAVAAFVVLDTFVKSPAGKPFRMIPQPIGTTVPIAIAVRKGDAAMLDRLDEGLRRIRASGEYDRIRRRWMPYDAQRPEARPPDPRAATV